MKVNYWLRIKRSGIRFAHLQLFLSLIAFPILISWGLPISLLSPIGTLLFGPLLTLFLLTSSLIFFLEICCLPNSLLIWLLERVTDVWLWFFSYEQKTWLVGFAKPPIIILLMIIIIAFAIMQCRHTSKANHAIPLFALLLVSTGITLKTVSTAHNTIESIERTPGNITVINQNNQTIVIDPGYIGRNSSAPSWVSYTLIPEIIKRTGKLTIDHLIVLQPNNLVFQALVPLCSKMTVNNLYIPWWTGKIPLSAWRSFAQLRETLPSTNTTLVRIYEKPLIITTPSLSVTIEPLEKQLTYHDATYPTLCVLGQIDKKPFRIYAAKHTKIKKKETYE